jgi:alkylation response protein AidB-like acyl-CoA dehydrogenase
MDFEFSSEQDMLQKAFADFLAKECSHDLVKAWHKDEKGYSPAVWKKMADLGWMELICDAIGNNEGTGFLDAVILFEEMGKALLPSPLFASAAMSGSMLLQVQDEDVVDKDLGDITSGKRIFTAALVNEKGEFDHNRPGVSAVSDGDGGYRLNGTRLFVPYADSAHYLLVCADVENGGPTIFKIKTDSTGFSIDPMETLYPERKCVVKLENVTVDASGIVGKVGRGGRYVDAVMGPITLLKCSEMLGGMDFIANTTVQYVKERHQFGKPLGVLQAIQHYCADMATLCEGARMMVYLAGSLINDGLDAEKEISMAKAWISDGYKKCTWISHQIHGGIGYTEEYPVHLYYRHAKENELRLGDARYHRDKLIRSMVL